jgi:hypothetical protein
MSFPEFGAWLGTSGLLSVVIFISVLVSVLIGRVAGHYSHLRSKGVKTATDDTLIGAILGLMALVIAFTFSGAAGRMDQRERLIAAETSAITSAYGALRYISPSDQETLKPLFRTFVSERADLYKNVADFESFNRQQKKIDTIINQIQDAAYLASLKVSAEARPLATEFVKLVNTMGSAYSGQLQAMWFHPPRIIWLTLILLILIGSFLAGYKMGVTQRRERLLSFMFAALISCAIYLILSLEFPLLFQVAHLESEGRQAVVLQDMLTQTVQPQANVDALK